MKFNPGDRVREIATGDEGIVTRGKFSSSTEGMRIYVKWETGELKGVELHSSEDDLELAQLAQKSPAAQTVSDDAEVPLTIMWRGRVYKLVEGE